MTDKCPLKQICQDDCKICTDENKNEKVQNFIETIKPIFENIIKVLSSTIESVIKDCEHKWKCIVETYPNKRVVHLALNHPKKRIRKKNINRIMRWIKKRGVTDDR